MYLSLSLSFFLPCAFRHTYAFSCYFQLLLHCPTLTAFFLRATHYISLLRPFAYSKHYTRAALFSSWKKNAFLNPLFIRSSRVCYWNSYKLKNPISENIPAFFRKKKKKNTSRSNVLIANREYTAGAILPILSHTHTHTQREFQKSSAESARAKNTGNSRRWQYAHSASFFSSRAYTARDYWNTPLLLHLLCAIPALAGMGRGWGINYFASCSLCSLTHRGGDMIKLSTKTKNGWSYRRRACREYIISFSI